MILQPAVLLVTRGTPAYYTDPFDRPRVIFEAATGYNSRRLLPGVVAETRYLLLVEWEHLEDHTEGFRGSPAYEEWKTLLHHFYDPFPEVDHYPLPDIDE